MGGMVARIGDPSSHDGTISTVTTTKTFAGGKLIATQGAMHTCPIPYHGTTPITAITTKSFVEGKLIVTQGAQAGCGATIMPVGVTVFAE